MSSYAASPPLLSPALSQRSPGHPAQAGDYGARQVPQAAHHASLARIQTTFDGPPPNQSQSATPAPGSSSAVSPLFELATPAPAREDDAEPPATAGEGGARAPVHPRRSEDIRAHIAPDLEAVVERAHEKSLKRKRGADEEAAMVETATRVAERLAADHLAVLCPDTETPFTDARDAVRRLLPFHVFQQPRAGLSAALGVHANKKGKGRATAQDLLREEIAETRLALGCWRRRKALQERFRRARIRSAKDASPEDQLYVLTQAMVEHERTESAALNAELKSARAELERVQREQRALAAAAASSSVTPATPARTPTATTAHHGVPRPTTAPTTTATATSSASTSFGTPYRPYTYYGGGYGGHAFSYNPYTAGSAYTTSVAAYGAGGSVPTLKPAFSTPAAANSTAAAAGSTSAFTPAPPLAAAPAPASTSQPSPAPSPAQTSQPPAQAPQQPPAPAKTLSVELPTGALAMLHALGISVADRGAAGAGAVVTGRGEGTVSVELDVQALQRTGGLAALRSALAAVREGAQGGSGAEDAVAE